MKKICVYIGSRANYSSCRSIMAALQQQPSLQLQTVLGGAAVLERFGNLEALLTADGFSIDAKFYMLVEGENPTTMAKSTGLGIIELSLIFSNLQPDLVLVVGDRFDIMAPVIAATYMNIPIAHTMGGEVSGTIDESIRHAVTKMAHLHFPANEDARQRILRLGENPEHVFNIGCPRLDTVQQILDEHRNGDRIDQAEFFTRHKGVGGIFDVEKERFLLVAQHPVTTEYGRNRKHINETLLALQQLQMPVIMLWPNADAGSDEVSKGIRHFREQNRPDWLHVFINLPMVDYIKLMDLCACMIGNSSSAIREGAFIGTRAVNVGTRQHQRVRARNVVDVAYDHTEIVDAVRAWLQQPRPPSSNIYGDGSAGGRLASILAEMPSFPIQKTISY